MGEIPFINSARHALGAFPLKGNGRVAVARCANETKKNETGLLGGGSVSFI